jgi:TatA/E family protein of Tat protein translocase
VPDIGAPELIIILVAVLIIFGPGKLPDLGRTLGKSIREFRSSVQEVNEEPEPTANVAASSATNPNDPPVE